MPEPYYKPCKELDICNELIEKYFHTQQYEQCFEGHLALAEQGYPLAECQIGYFYYDGLGVEKDLEKAVYWTRRAAEHGDRDGQCNLAWFYEDGIGVERDMEQASHWYRKAALQDHDLAIKKCRELGIDLAAQPIEQEEALSESPCRVKHRSPEEMRSLLNRLSRIEGQLRGIRGMVEREAYCPDILTQTAAACAALSAFSQELLGNHIRTCVVKDIREGHDEVGDELMQMLRRFMK